MWDTVFVQLLRTGRNWANMVSVGCFCLFCESAMRLCHLIESWSLEVAGTLASWVLKMVSESLDQSVSSSGEHPILLQYLREEQWVDLCGTQVPALSP